MSKKLFLHDWSGHPFQIQLSRELARRGYAVEHAYFAGIQGPTGDLALRPDDSDNLAITPLSIPQTYAKYSFVKRWFQERHYAELIARRIRERKPEVVISSNTPIEIQAAMMKASRSIGARFVFWLQDVQSVAMRRILPKRYPVVGSLIAGHYDRLEHRLLARSDAVVAICDDFATHLIKRKVHPERISVIENWAPLDELPEHNKDNEWSRRYGLQDRIVFLYAGTLGLKHNPELLSALAADCAKLPNAVVVVASEGTGADWLRQRKQAESLDRLLLLPFQDYRDLPAMLAAGDVLLSIIEPDAAEFSVPSKVLSYMAAGRAVLLSVPAENLASRLVTRADAGLVTPPGDIDAFLAAARQLIADDTIRAHKAAGARCYAAATFDIHRIADRFIAVIEGTRPADPDSSAPGAPAEISTDTFLRTI